MDGSDDVARKREATDFTQRHQRASVGAGRQCAALQRIVSEPRGAWAKPDGRPQGIRYTDF